MAVPRKHSWSRGEEQSCYAQQQWIPHLTWLHSWCGVALCRPGAKRHGQSSASCSPGEGCSLGNHVALKAKLPLTIQPRLLNRTWTALPPLGGHWTALGVAGEAAPFYGQDRAAQTLVKAPQVAQPSRRDCTSWPNHTALHPHTEPREGGNKLSFPQVEISAAGCGSIHPDQICKESLPTASPMEVLFPP